jgi:hypothetical protein
MRKVIAKLCQVLAFVVSGAKTGAVWSSLVDFRGFGAPDW